MSILTNNLPTKIKVHDKVYDINYDYRTAIRVLTAFEDDELTREEKFYIMVKNIYKEDIPDDDFIEACEKARRFIDCDDKFKNNKDSSARTYSFTKDADYIFTGINSSHHIDIDKESDLHWWKFMNFFMDMSPDCVFGELIYYRKRKSEGKLTSEEKKHYKEIKDLVDIENVNNHSEARQEFLKEFHKS